MDASLSNKVSFFAFLRLTRSYNLFIIVLTQYFVYLFLINDNFSPFEKLLNTEFFLITLSTVIIAASGYIINDYHDVKIDMINKPGRVIIGEYLSRRVALILYLLFCMVGISLGFLVSFKVGLINFFAAGILWAYSVKFKKTALLGNLSIAMLTALTVLIIYVWKPFLGGKALLAYAWFAFIITLIREIIKDIEDIRGDKAYDCKTLPIIWGIAKTVRFVQVLIWLMTGSLIFLGFITTNIYLQISAGVIIIQLLYLSFNLSKTDTVKGFKKLGKFCKYIMITGILAMLFF